MRKLMSFLFISLDGVVESPNTFVRPNVFIEFTELIRENHSQFWKKRSAVVPVVALSKYSAGVLSPSELCGHIHSTSCSRLRSGNR